MGDKGRKASTAAVPSKKNLPSKAAAAAAIDSPRTAVATLQAAGRRFSVAVAQLRLLLFVVLCRPLARRPRPSVAATAVAPRASLASDVGRASTYLMRGIAPPQSFGSAAQAAVAALASVALFVVADVALRTVFAAHALAFPSSLAGGSPLFSNLVIDERVSVKHTTARSSRILYIWLSAPHPPGGFLSILVSFSLQACSGCSFRFWRSKPRRQPPPAQP
jgi:hypothetical protein